LPKTPRRFTEAPQIITSTKEGTENMSQLQKLYDMRLVEILSGSSLPRFEREEGQTLAEYAMILALIAIVAAVAVGVLGNQISSLFSTIGSDV